MKKILFSLMTILSLLMLSCITENTTNDNKYDVTIKCFTCDSTGFPITVFETNGLFYCAVLIKNISNMSINYRKVKVSSTLFDPAWGLIGGDLPGVEVGFPENMWGDYVILPGEEIYQIQEYRIDKDICPPGEYIITYDLRLTFPKTIRVYDNTAIGYFTIKEEKR